MTTEPRTVTPPEARQQIQQWLEGITSRQPRREVEDLLDLVDTESERIADAQRVAVVKALWMAASRLAAFGHQAAALHLRQDADAIENGAPL